MNTSSSPKKDLSKIIRRKNRFSKVQSLQSFSKVKIKFVCFLHDLKSVCKCLVQIQIV